MIMYRGGFSQCASVQFILTADVQRIGVQTMSAVMAPTMPSAERDLSEPAELQKINNLMITEWEQFVAREKKVS